MSPSLSLRVLARLLGYPDAELRAQLPALREVLRGEGAVGAARLAELDALVEALAGAEQLAAELAKTDIQTPKIPVIHNASVTSSTDANEIRELLAKQLFNPVRWVETVNFLAAQGVDTLIECGPGKVLAGLAKRIDKGLNAQPLFDMASLEKTKQLAGDNA